MKSRSFFLQLGTSQIAFLSPVAWCFLLLSGVAAGAAEGLGQDFLNPPRAALTKMK